MPNWTQNRLIILAPQEHLNALLNDMEGPAYWQTPELSLPYNGITFDSAHHELSAKKEIADPEKAEALRKEYRTVNGLPDWMPVSSSDMLMWLKENKKKFEHFETVPFSIPKMAPIKDIEEFNSFFGGEIDTLGYWTKTKENTPGAIGICQNRTGVKWPPGSQNIEVDSKAGPNDLSVIAITYDTPWAPVENLADFLEPILEKYGAKAALAWEEEDSNSGWNYINPKGESNEDYFEHGQFLYQVESDDEDEEEAYHDWDHESFIEACLEAIGDNDFNGLL